MSVIKRDGTMRERPYTVSTHPQRRGVRQPIRGGSALTVETLAERLVATDAGDGDAVADGRRVAPRLNHTHLPKSAGMNAVTDNREATESSRDDSGGD